MALLGEWWKDLSLEVSSAGNVVKSDLGMTSVYWKKVDLDGGSCFTMPDKKLFQVKKTSFYNLECYWPNIFNTGFVNIDIKLGNLYIWIGKIGLKD